jgi:hypothetical protein
MSKGMSVCSSKQLTFLCLLEERNNNASLLISSSVAGISESTASFIKHEFVVVIERGKQVRI